MHNELKFDSVRQAAYRKAGYWGDATLLDYWNIAVACAPDKEAVVDTHHTRYSYKTLDQAASRLAAYFIESRVLPGDIVSFQIPGWAEFTIIYVACLKVGAVANPILPNFRINELLYMLNKCSTKILFIPHEFRRYRFTEMVPELQAKVPSLQKIIVVDKQKTLPASLMAENPDFTTLDSIQSRNDLPCQIQKPCTRADELAIILFTSGTEGAPKGVMHTHNNVIAGLKSSIATFGISYLDTMLMPAPVAHVTGFFRGVIMPQMAQAKSVLQDIFAPAEMLATIEKEKCTCTVGSTPFLHDALIELERSAYDLSSLRIFFCGGAPIPESTIQKALSKDICIVRLYGASECVSQVATRLNDPADKIIKTDGRTLPGIEMKIVDCHRQTLSFEQEGEIATRGPNIFSGYYNAPDLTAKAIDAQGWYYSGDLGIMDKDGFIRITGRIKDVIIRGGENISSKELEDIILQHPKVYEASVVAMPDARLGEKTCVYVTLNDPGAVFTFQEMTALFAAANIAKYKFPERLEIIEHMPKTASGKVQKNRLRKDIAQKLLEEK